MESVFFTCLHTSVISQKLLEEYEVAGRLVWTAIRFRFGKPSICCWLCRIMAGTQVISLRHAKSLPFLGLLCLVTLCVCVCV